MPFVQSYSRALNRTESLLAGVDEAQSRWVFDGVAASYDRVRPGYPEAAFADATRLTGLGEGFRVLEIGCGTGQATLPLARMGLDVVALEPGPALARIAQARLAGFPKVQIRLQSFEEQDLEGTPFDAVVAATSFHWLDPETRVERAARLMRPGGALILLSNVQRLNYSEFFERVQAVYQLHVPEWSRRDPDPTWQHIPTQIQAVDEDGWFETVSVTTYDRRTSYPRERYLELLRTFSDHRTLGERRLRALLGDIGTLIDDEFDGRVIKPWRTILQVAIQTPR